MAHISLVDLAHKVIATQLKPGDIAIDATAGNGHDTLFLAQHVGMQGRVYSFDTQATAIKNTTSKLQQAGLSNRVELIQAGHQHWLDYLPEQYIGNISAIMFNLGYLPGADKTITTLTDSTLQALEQVQILLSSTTGCMTIMAYPGHPQGKLELDAIEQWCQQLEGGKFFIEKITLDDTRALAPQLFIIKTYG
jgi:tRNA A58 N-methylase Trm61